MPIAFKTPSEIKPVLYDFEEELAGGTIESVDLVQAEGPAGAAALDAAAQDFSETTVAVIWRGGEDGKDYSTLVRVSTSDGLTLETGGEISIRANGPIVPDIPGTYLSAASYVDRFGRQETVELTSEDPGGRIDYAKLAKALQDATEEVDSYLAGRYALPLAQPYPGVIEGIVADIARLRLHVNAPPQEVRDRASDARKLLKDLGTGTALLPGADGAVTPTSGAGAPAYVAPDRVFTSDKLARFAGGPPGF